MGTYWRVISIIEGYMKRGGGERVFFSVMFFIYRKRLEFFGIINEIEYIELKK